jgi:hypothetical protein
VKQNDETRLKQGSNNYLIEFMRSIPLRHVPKPEELICLQLVAYLKEKTLLGKCKHVWFHVPNEGNSPNKQLNGAKQRNIGKFAGVADYIFLGEPSAALEIKNGKKKLSPAQETFKKWCLDRGILFDVAGSVDEAISFLERNEITF